jgi:hypothetical protein
MAQDLIRYDLLTQDALRGVVRNVLMDVAKNGLPGDHHFFISFSTTAPGVRVSNRLRESYPEEMTVVLQHQFWDLEVTDTGFSISLSFNGVPERVVVPFASIKGFLDPSVQFGLQFDPGTPVEANDAGEVGDIPSPETVEGAPADKPARAKSGKAKKDKPDTAQPAAVTSSDEDTVEPQDAESQSAEVVSLDTFRKKS